MQKLLDEAASKNNNSILNYVLPRTPRENIDQQRNIESHTVEKEAKTLKACSSDKKL